ncbi:MAG: pantothenate kinase [Caulobacter sp.]|nr:pantothenate kinase [Caulobacter sp.]
MLLAIEQGNTNTLFAVHDGQEWIAQWRTATESTRTADEYAVWLAQLLAMSGMSLGALTGCIISSVVPQSLFNLRNLSRRYLHVEPLVIGENAELGIPVRIDKPSEAGADRLVNAIGAHIKYPGPLIVIDSGTATTFDVIGLIEGLIKRIKDERGGHLTVVATGGVFSLFEGATDAIDIFDGDLTIRGLLEIHRRNTT